MGMRSNPQLDALVRAAEGAGARVLTTRLPDAGPVDRVGEFPDTAPPEAPARVVLDIPGWRPPSLNQLMRGTLRTRIRLEREARDYVAWAWNRARTPPATRRRRVSVEVTLSGRQRPTDPDNSYKPLLDALKHAGAIVDDSAEFCELGTITFARGERTSTRVVLDDL